MAAWNFLMVLALGCAWRDGEECAPDECPGDEPTDSTPDCCTDDFDDDNDGFSENEGDCDDAQAAINPSATDLVGDAIDQNCDGVDGFDGDGDGYADEAGGGDDCDDADPLTFPDAPEIWYDGKAQGCGTPCSESPDDPPPGCWAGDGDQDGDDHDATVVGGADCLDTDPEIHPDAPEYNGNDVDDNCNGLTDQFFLTMTWATSDPILTLSITDVSNTVKGNVSPILTIADSTGKNKTYEFDDLEQDTTAVRRITDAELPWDAPAMDQTFMLKQPTEPILCWAWGLDPNTLDPANLCLREDPSAF